MSALPVTTPASDEKAFLDGLGMPSKKRGITFEALFYRQLHGVIEHINAALTLDQLLLEVVNHICKLLNADRLSLYFVSEDKESIVTRAKTGLSATTDIKLPINIQSLAGFCALNRQLLNIKDVYDEVELRRINGQLNFLKEVDKRTGYRTKQMMVAPIIDNEELVGVLQVINNRNDEDFLDLEVDGVAEICKALGPAIRLSIKREIAAKRTPTPYDGLINSGLMSDAEIADCKETSRNSGTSIEEALFGKYGIKPRDLGASLSSYYKVPYEHFNPARLSIEALHGQLKRDYMEQQEWFPLEDTPEGLLIVCLDPGSVNVKRSVKGLFPKTQKFTYSVTTRHDFTLTLDHFFGHASDRTESIEFMLTDMEGPVAPEEASDDLFESAAADNELVRFVNKLIVDAYNQKASDIHVEPLPGKGKTGIRFRIDGSLVPYIEVPSNFRQAMVARLKIMCDLDISERRKPQDGKIKFKKYGPLDIELRVATIPSAGGVEDVVMRILAAGEPIPLEKLGLTGHNKKRLESTVSKPYGLFYVCGPTGSGKTTTLHSILKFLNTPDTKIWTAEDPVEITQKGLRQVQINKKAGIDFALVMRAFLRADPDIIMVGESRDKETVSMGVEASLTGHLVFSTLHTNSAPESITRLMDMGMDPFNFADALLGILAQRLAKRLCDCKESYYPDNEEVRLFSLEYAEELRQTKSWKIDPDGERKKLTDSWVETYGENGRFKLYKAKGCEKCNQTGYKGRIGLHELLVADDPVKKLIQERARVADLFSASVESGMRTLKMDGMEKIMMGMTDLKMVRQVCIK